MKALIRPGRGWTIHFIDEGEKMFYGWSPFMICENEEGYSDFNMDPDWWKNRPIGISAVIRCYNDFDILGWCIESILPLVDEIVVTYTPVENDLTVAVCNGFKDKRIKCFEYPFKMKKPKELKFEVRNISCRSVRDFAYYTNWGMTKTTYSHVAPKWDVDQVMRSEYSMNQDFRNKILKNHSVWIHGYNVLDIEFKTVSEKIPISAFPNGEPRFVKAGPFMFLPGSMSRGEGDSGCWPYYLTLGMPRFIFFYSNHLLGKIVHIKDPVFFHLAFLRSTLKDKTISKGNFTSDYTKPFPLNNIKYPDFMKKTLEEYINGSR
jgi:hypothetical protein